MVFPHGAKIWELVADHLDHLPGKSLIDRLVQKCGVAKNDHTTGTNQPHHEAEDAGNQGDWDRNDPKAGIKLHCREALGAKLEILTVKLANDEHAHGDKDDVEQDQGLGEEAVDAEHQEDDGIVAREVAEVVVDTRLHLDKVLGLVHTLDVEELGEGLEVGKAVANGVGAQAAEALPHAEARGEQVDGNLDGHAVGVGGFASTAKRGGGEEIRGDQQAWCLDDGC